MKRAQLEEGKSMRKSGSCSDRKISSDQRKLLNDELGKSPKEEINFLREDLKKIKNGINQFNIKIQKSAGMCDSIERVEPDE